MSKQVIIDMYQLLRLVCARDLQRNPINVGGGGQNFVVQVDESMIRHGQRVRQILKLAFYKKMYLPPNKASFDHILPPLGNISIYPTFTEYKHFKQTSETGNDFVPIL